MESGSLPCRVHRGSAHVRTIPWLFGRRMRSMQLSLMYLQPFTPPAALPSAREQQQHLHRCRRS